MENLLIIDKNPYGFPEISDKIALEPDLNINSCETFEDAINILINDSADCILITVDFIEESDIKLFKAIKKHKTTKTTPTILIGESVDRNSEKLIDDLLSLGIYDVLINPNYEGLMRKIKKSIDYKKSYCRAKMFKRHYLAMFRSSRDLCFMVDKDLNIRLFNGSSTKRFNLNQKHLGKNFVTIFPKSMETTIYKVLTDEKYLDKREFLFKTLMRSQELIKWKVSRIANEKGKVVSSIIIGEIEKSIQTETASSNKDLEELKEKVKKLQLMLERSKNQVDNCEKLKMDLEQAQMIIKDKEEKHESLLKEITQLESVNSKVNELKSELEGKHKELEVIERIKTQLKESHDVSQNTMGFLNNEIEQVKTSNDKLEKVLQQYTSKATWSYLVDRIIPQDEKANETFVMEGYGTMIFGDIQGFTKFAEKYSLSEVLESLNQMFNLVTETIYGFNGDIDKFMGDAFFAYFDDPLNAVKSVLNIAKKVDEANDDRMMSGLTPLFFRFGVNYGKAVRGDIGSHLRRENTLIGDAVNVAQRLESSSIPGQVLISDSTYELIKDHIIVTREVELKLKGRKGMVKAYYVDGLKNPDEEQQNEEQQNEE